MAYNHGFEFKKFEARQRILRLQYEQLGMPEADIAALYQADLQEFNSDRRHEEHRPERLEDYIPLAATEDGEHSRLWWVEETVLLLRSLRRSRQHRSLPRSAR